MNGCGCGMQATTQEELKVLRLLLVICGRLSILHEAKETSTNSSYSAGVSE